jgi:hypothetical protein
MRAVNGAALEDDLRRWLRAGSKTAAEAAFRMVYGQDMTRFERATRALAYLKQHQAELAERGLLSLGEREGDIHLEPRFADELARLL